MRGVFIGLIAIIPGAISCKQHRPCCKNSQKIMESEYCLNLQNFNLFFSFFLVFFPAVFYKQRIGGVCVRAAGTPTETCTRVRSARAVATDTA